jgi:U3 small nucleolar RNA-associated protein 5
VVDAAPELPRGGGGGDKKQGKRKKKEHAMDARNAVDAMDADDPSLVSHEGGKTLGERALDAERSRTKSKETSVERRDSADAAARADRSIREALGDGKKPPKADSLATLFAQALAAEDRSLIERCLSVGDAGVVSNTVARLPPSSVASLLRAALDRMRSRPARGEHIARWMRAAMLHHSSYIAGSATARTAVLELQQTVEAHQALQRPLQQLLGRLDLLLHKQSEAKRLRAGSGGENGEGTDDDSDAEGPVNVYDEGDEDLEDVMEEGDEESDWETDGETDGEGEEEEDSDDDESDSE